MAVGPRNRRKRVLAVMVAGAAVMATGVVLLSGNSIIECDVCEAATQIILRGTVAQNCTLNVASDPAATNLPLTANGAQRVQVGSVTQSCNKKAGYTVSVESANCAAAPAGAKVRDGVSTEYLRYSAEFANPTTGGSQTVVTGLLATTCTNQVGRNVTNAKVRDEISTVFVNFTGDDELAAGTYQDTLTLTMNIK